MTALGTVESLWRYPVKSMRGEELNEVFVGYAGVYGDRRFAFRSAANRAGFPFFTARDQREMLRYRPRFRHAEKVIAPINQAEAEANGATPLYAEAADFIVDVQTPAGDTFAIDDPGLMDRLRAGLDASHHLSLLRSERALADCRPVSLMSLQTVRQLTRETGTELDKRRFRANIYLDLPAAAGFAEDRFVGRALRLGSKVVVSILERDARCMVITLDPETGEKTPALLKAVAQSHDGMAGVYAAVLVEGMIRKDDAVDLLD